VRTARQYEDRQHGCQALARMFSWNLQALWKRPISLLKVIMIGDKSGPCRYLRCNTISEPVFPYFPDRYRCRPSSFQDSYFCAISRSSSLLGAHVHASLCPSIRNGNPTSAELEIKGAVSTIRGQPQAGKLFRPAEKETEGHVSHIADACR
jgi:hypothetical protein